MDVPVVVLLLLQLLASTVGGVEPRVASSVEYASVRTYNRSALYLIMADTSYDHPPYLIDLRGSRYGETRDC